MSPRLLLLPGPDGTSAEVLRTGLGTSVEVETLPTAPEAASKAHEGPIAGLVVDLRADPTADAVASLAAAGLSPREDRPLLLILPVRIAAVRVDALLSLPGAEIFYGSLALKSLAARVRSLASAARAGMEASPEQAWLFRGQSGTAEVNHRGLDLPETLESGLLDSESRIRRILDSLPVMVWMGADGTRATWFNRRWLEFRGRSLQEESGEGWIDGVHPDDRERCRQAYLDCFEGRRPCHVEYRLRRHDGEYRWVADQAAPMLLADGTFSGYIGGCVDITGHRLLEEDMRRSRDNLRVILKGVRSAVLMMDSDARVTFANEQAAVHMGFPSAEALMAADMREFRDRFEILDEAGKPYPQEAFPNRVAFREGRDAEAVLRFRPKPGGEERWSWVKASPVFDPGGRVTRVVQIIEDITGLRQAEEQLRQSQKMDAVGQLAGGIAHDFNNLLTAINGYSQLALTHQGSLEEAREYLQEVAAAGEKASALTRQLLSFSRKQNVTQRPLSLNESVAALGGMLTRLLGEDIRFSTALDEAIPPVLGDKAQVDQVLLNLCLNARDAMPSGGALRVETRACDVSPRGWYGNLDISPGRYAQLEVSDTGIGMSPLVRGRIFEPFFTTKPKDRGTGLGLSTVYSIVRQMGGFIHVTSEEGKGSSFRILFPGRVAGEAEAPAAHPRHVLEPPEAKGAILLVEDDARVQRLAVAVLRARGYTVHAFSEGESAVEWARACADPIDLLLSDAVLPGIGGAEVVSRMQDLRPGLRVALMSGYTDDALVRKGVGDARIPFLQKPFVPSGLLAFVAGLLASTPPAASPRSGMKASAPAGAA